MDGHESYPWPAWKFGLRQSDLFTTLHDRYNSIHFNLQNASAFHHDVNEISHNADSLEEFHRQMDLRHRQRLRELNESLEALAVEIVANPKLMSDDQWQHALRVFRSKSLDSIIEFFATYLPDHHSDYNDASSTSGSSDADSVHTLSTKASSSDHIYSSLFLDGELPPHDSEPCSPNHDDACPEDVMSSVSSLSDFHSRGFSTNPPSRSMSFSGSEYGCCHMDDVSENDAQPADDDAAATSCSPSQSGSSLPPQDNDEFPSAHHAQEQFDPLGPVTSVDTTMESNTPTPRQDGTACCYMDYKPVKWKASQQSPSPKPLCRSVGSPARDVRRSPEEALSRVQKPMPDALRKRPRGRRRLERKYCEASGCI